MFSGLSPGFFAATEFVFRIVIAKQPAVLR